MRPGRKERVSPINSGNDFASDWRSEGERPGRNDKGLITADRTVKKDAFYLYKAFWNPEPMIHICSTRYATRTAGPVEVRVYSNCESVTLAINGEEVSVQSGSSRVFEWKDVQLAPGENRIEVRGVAEGNQVTDACVWNVG